MGLAISDEAGLIARPLLVFHRTNRRDDLRRLRLLTRDHQVNRVVLGLPIHLDGSTSEMAAEVKRFAARLKKEIGLPVELVDERLSSWEAGQSTAGIRETGVARKEKKRATGRTAPRDDVAAAIILRDYLANQKSTRPAGHASEKS
jgi:putative pre-16S rRNA nuclease